MRRKKTTPGLSSEEIRQRFLKFFEKRHHAIIPSASLVPEGDSSVLFNTAGMQPLVPYLLGERHPHGKRLANVQKCLRTVDIEEVGDKTHLTFFEMLGNWSLGDYFKKEALEWSYEFLTSEKDGLGLDPERLYVTVFRGNKDISREKEAVKVWKELIDERRIFYAGEDNWWSPGDNGPCGPTSEMFYDRTKKGLGIISEDEFFEAEERQEVVEIWNDVFMEFEKKDGKIIGKLKNKNIDTGAGLERITAVLQEASSPYETDLFSDIIEILEKYSQQSYSGKYQEDFRIIADHLRSAVFLISDGVVPDNKDQGYVLRRLLRRASMKMNNIGFDLKKLRAISKVIIKKYEGVYASLREKEDQIKTEIEFEIDKFQKTVERGMKEFKKMIDPEVHNNNIKTIDFGVCDIDGYALNELSGDEIFKLNTTYGLPFELIREEAEKNNIVLDEDCFQEKLKEHQKMSNTAAAGKFKGGLAGDSEIITAFHTATHLLLAGLRKFLGDHVLQRGSNITEDRTRFDFLHHEKVDRKILDQVEDYVNEAIAQGARVEITEMDKEEAHHSKDIVGAFWEKYPDRVKIYSITDGKNVYSQELCGGPHVENTIDLSKFGKFKIVKEKSSSAGVRRVKAIFEKI